MDTIGPPPLAIVGASGGLGASTLALAVGRRVAAHHGTSVVVDLDPDRGGLEVTAGIEHLPGHRWEGLRRVNGRAPAEELLAGLPAEAGCHILSGGGAGPRSPGGVPDRALLDVVESLRCSRTPVVLDLPATSSLVPALVVGGVGVVLLVALHTRGLADADAAVERLLDGAHGHDPGLDLSVVTRGGRVSPEVVEDLVHHLGVAHLHHLADDRRVLRAAERGLWPGDGRDAVRACAEAVVLGSTARREAS